VLEGESGFLFTASAIASDSAVRAFFLISGFVIVRGIKSNIARNRTFDGWDYFVSAITVFRSDAFVSIVTSGTSLQRCEVGAIGPITEVLPFQVFQHRCTFHWRGWTL
jgi:hypothetical protein